MSLPANEVEIEDSRDSDTLQLLTQDLIDKSSEDLEKEDLESEKEIAKKEPDDNEKLEIAEEEPEDEKKDEIFSPSANRKEILKEFPELFKKFPSLQKDMYQAREYREIFSSIDEAKYASDRASTLDSAESALFAGNTEDILKSVKSSDNDAFLRVVDNFLPTLRKLDQAAYIHTCGQIGREIVKSLLVTAKGLPEDGEDHKALNFAASVLNRFMFNSTQYVEPGQKLTKPLSDADVKVQQERITQIQQRINDVHEELSERTENSIKAGVLDIIDPKNLMSNYIKQNAVRDVMDKLEAEIEQDKEYKLYQDKLWKQIIADNFSRSSQEKLKVAYINEAKRLLPNIIRNVRNEALSNKTAVRAKVVEEKEEISREATPRKSRETNRDSSPERRQPRSTLDILNEE